MTKDKKPDVEKIVNSVANYVEDVIKFIKKRKPSPETAKEVTALEDAINDKFKGLLPHEQAHMLFFAIMIITKLARIEPRSGQTFSNPILMAQTFMVVMNEAVSKLGMDIVDIAFSVEAEPTYEMKEGDLDRLAADLKGMNLADLDPKGNA